MTSPQSSPRPGVRPGTRCSRRWESGHEQARRRRRPGRRAARRCVREAVTYYTNVDESFRNFPSCQLPIYFYFGTTRHPTDDVSFVEHWFALAGGLEIMVPDPAASLADSSNGGPMACPACGSATRREITPGYYECLGTPALAPNLALGPPGTMPIQSYRPYLVPCGVRYREGPRTAALECAVCRADIDGRCEECGVYLCRRHFQLRDNRRLCPQHADVHDRKLDDVRREREEEWLAALPKAERLFWLGLPMDPLDQHVELREAPSWGNSDLIARSLARTQETLGGPLGLGSALFERLSQVLTVEHYRARSGLMGKKKDHFSYLAFTEAVGLCSDGTAVHFSNGSYEFIRNGQKVGGWAHGKVIAYAIRVYNNRLPRRVGRDRWKSAIPQKPNPSLQESRPLTEATKREILDMYRYKNMGYAEIELTLGLFGGRVLQTLTEAGIKNPHDYLN